MRLVLLLTRNNTSYAAFGIRNIAFISWNQVHVTMKYRLPSGFVDIDADVIAIRMKTFVNFLLHILQHDVHGLTLMVRQVEVGGDVPFGNDERMTRRDRITIVECNTSCRLADDFHSTGKAAERTLLAFHARQLVEMVILVEFVALVGDEALVRQFNITLVCIFLMNGMEPEAFFLKVAAYGKIGRSLR